MNEQLWQLYMRLQTDLAYGESVTSGEINIHQHGLVDQYLSGLRADRVFAQGLVIGPGGGSEVAQIAQWVEHLTVVTAHQAEAAALQQLQQPELAKVARVVQGDIHALPVESSSVDFVYAANVLEHCFAPYIALMECRRVLQYGGVAYFVVPSFEGGEGGRGAFHLHCLTRQVWSALLEKTGLALVDTRLEVGEVDPMCTYTHYRCAAVAPPGPHAAILRELISYRVGAP